MSKSSLKTVSSMVAFPPCKPLACAFALQMKYQNKYFTPPFAPHFMRQMARKNTKGTKNENEKQKS
jgi:hypothetical protein